MNNETIVITLAEHEITSIACPFQVEGKTIDGKDFYFRCRHNEWRLELDDTTISRGDGDVTSIDEMVTSLKTDNIKVLKMVDL